MADHVGTTSSRDEMALFIGQLFELSGAFRRTGDRIARRVGQTQARWQVLSVADLGGLTVPAIARRLGISRQAVQPLVDTLVADGLMTLDDNPAHRRSPLVALTARGSQALAALDEAGASVNELAAAVVGPDDLAVARRVVAALLAAVGDIAAGAEPHS